MAINKQMKNLLKYIQGLNYLRKVSPNAARGVLTAFNFNHQSQDDTFKKLRIYQDLAEHMLDKDTFNEIVENAKGLVVDAEKLNKFLEMIGEDRLPPPPLPPGLIKDFMQPVPKKVKFSPTATLSDFLAFCDKVGDEQNRYFMVVDDIKETLLGIISINDYPDDAVINSLSMETQVTSLPFFNPDPRVDEETAPMAGVSSKFDVISRSGQKITKLIIVDKNKKLVGTLGKFDVLHWRKKE